MYYLDNIFSLIQAAFRFFKTEGVFVWQDRTHGCIMHVADEGSCGFDSSYWPIQFLAIAKLWVSRMLMLRTKLRILMVKIFCS